MKAIIVVLCFHFEYVQNNHKLISYHLHCPLTYLPLNSYVIIILDTENTRITTKEDLETFRSCFAKVLTLKLLYRASTKRRFSNKRDNSDTSSNSDRRHSTNKKVIGNLVMR